jgi:uncharacterized protein YndB with AHSA1/START domain
LRKPRRRAGLAFEHEILINVDFRGVVMTETTSATEAPSYQSQVQFSKPPDVVFDALTTVTGLAGWYSPVTGSGAAGGELRFTHQHADPLVISVDTADRPRSVAWTVLAYPLQPDWVGTHITFMLRPSQSGGTTLEFRHQGLTPHLECYDQCSRGWDYFLPSLRDYVETGTGNPFG